MEPTPNGHPKSRPKPKQDSDRLHESAGSLSIKTPDPPQPSKKPTSSPQTHTFTQVGEQLIEVFDRLSNIKKPGFFRKNTEPTEEETFAIVSKLLNNATTADLFKFFTKCSTEIELFLALTFNPANKNKKLSESAIELSSSLILLSSEVYLDFNKRVRCFAGSSLSQNQQLGELSSSSTTAPRLGSLYGHSLSLLSTFFASGSPRSFTYKLKIEKLKHFKNYEARLAESEGKEKSKDHRREDPLAELGEQISKTVVSAPESRLLPVCQTVFELLGEVIAISDGGRMDTRHDTYSLEIVSFIKDKRRIFDLLASLFDALLAKPDHQLALMSLMQNQVAKYIQRLLENINKAINLDLLVLTFELISKLFQKRKQMVHQNEDDEAEFDLSGSSDDKTPASVSTLSKENNDESESFRHLQTMTGRMYKLLVDRLLSLTPSEDLEDNWQMIHQQSMSKFQMPSSTSTASAILAPTSVLMKNQQANKDKKGEQDGGTNTSEIDFDIFKLFTNSCQMVNYLEVFENQYSLKLIKSLMQKFKTAIELAKDNQKAADRVVKILKVSQCGERNKPCSCFVNELMNIFFKLALKTSQAMIKELFKQLFELLNTSLSCPVLVNQLPHCLFKVFAKNFASILSQNLETIQKMSIQLMTPDEMTSPDSSYLKFGSNSSRMNIPFPSSHTLQPSTMAIVDYRKTASIGAIRFNIFPEFIRINGKHVRITKEVCETILMIVARTPGVEKFLAGDIIKVDLGLEENQIITTHDLNQMLQERWQVKLLFFRAALVKMCSRVLLAIYHKEDHNKAFQAFHGFFSDLNEKRYQSVHSFNLGFITDLFTKRFGLADYKSPSFFKFMTIFDIQMRGIGYYDRDERIPLPGPVKKDFLEMLVTPLKVKIDTNETRLLMLQLLICKRLDDMIFRDPPVLKCLVPLMFDVASEILINFDSIDFTHKDIQDGVKVISSEPTGVPNSSSSQCPTLQPVENTQEFTINNLMAVVLKILVGVLNITSLYSKFPIILKPQVFANGKFISAGGFPYATFGDIKAHILKEEHLSRLIKMVDKHATSSLAQTYLAKLLNFASYRNPQAVVPLFPLLFSKCTDLSCSDEVYKIRMKLVISLLALDNNCIMNAGCLLENIIDRFETLISGPKFSSIKKQWFLTVLMKWVYLCTQSELPIERIRTLITNLKNSTDKDQFLLENSMILESYLASIRGLFTTGPKNLRVPSLFDEWTIMGRKKMHQMVSMIDKYYKDESIEEEARLLQYHFDLNLFEFFTQDRKHMPFTKLLEGLLQKIKPSDMKWMYIYDTKNVILYSVAESAPGELCIFKRHIGGKICWFLEESKENLYVRKGKLEILKPQNCRRTSYRDTPDQSILSNLLSLYRAKQDLLFPTSVRYPDMNLLELAESESEPERRCFIDKYPDYLKSYWDLSSNSDSGNNPSANIGKQLKNNRVVASFSTEGPNMAVSNTTPKSNPQNLRQPNIATSGVKKEPESGDQSEESENLKDYSEGPDFSDSSRRQSLTNSERNIRTDPGSKDMSISSLSTNTGLIDLRIRFILQLGLFTQAAPNSTREQIKLARDFRIFDVDTAQELKSRFKSSLHIIDKNKIINMFKVGILFAGPDQDKEEDILANEYPTSGLFPKFINALGERQAGGNVQKYLGSDMIQYTVGPLINRKSAANTVEVKRIVGNTPTLILWSQNPFSINFDEFKSKFTNEKIIIEELPNGLLKVRTIRKMEDKGLDEVFKIDALMDLDCLLNMIHSYIFSTQMEINPKLFNQLTKDYKMISPFLEARKKKIRELTEVYADATKNLNIDTLCDLIFLNSKK